jgi:HK97 family phage portal protein
MNPLDSLRVKAALSILPNSARSSLRFISDRTPNVPIYSDMTVARATRQGYKISVYVYRAIRTIVQAGSAIPWVALDKNGVVNDKHPFMDLVRHPNPEFAWQDIMEFLIAHLELCGNALWQPLMVGGIPREIWPAYPDLISPIPSDIPGQWLKGWQVTSTQGQWVAPPEQFVHFMQMDPGNPYWGTSPLMAAAKTIDTDNEAQDTQKVSMQNRGTPSGVFAHDTDMTAEQFEEARRRVRELYLAKNTRREPWVLGGGVKWQQMALTPVEMDYVASRLRNLRDIAGAFGISPAFLGDMEQATYSNMAQYRLSLYEDVVLPMLDDIKAALNLRLAPLYGGGMSIAYDTSNVAALKADYGEKVKTAQTLWSMGVPVEQINTKLNLGLTEYPGWDAGYIPFTLQETKMLGPGMEVKAVTEQFKAAAWNRLDRRRVAWWPVIAKKVMPLYEAERDAVVKSTGENAAMAAIEALAPQWQKVMLGVLSAIVEDFGREQAESLGSVRSTTGFERKWSFNPMEAALLAWLQATAAEDVKTIIATNLDDVRRVIREGVTSNLSNDDIARSLRQFYEDRSPYKAMRIARTETTKGATHATLEAAKQSGLCDMKMWLTARDDRVRDEHAAMEGEMVALDARFSNGLEGPGEPNCRCVIITPVR